MTNDLVSKKIIKGIELEIPEVTNFTSSSNNIVTFQYNGTHVVAQRLAGKSERYSILSVGESLTIPESYSDNQDRSRRRAGRKNW